MFRCFANGRGELQALVEPFRPMLELSERMAVSFRMRDAPGPGVGNSPA